MSEEEKKEEYKPEDDESPTGKPLTNIGAQLSNVPAWNKYVGEYYAERQKQLNEEGKKQELTISTFELDGDGIPVYNDEGNIIIKNTHTYKRRPLTWKQVKSIEDIRSRLTRFPADSDKSKKLGTELYEKLALWCYGIPKENLDACDFKKLQFSLDATFQNIISGAPS